MSFANYEMEVIRWATDRGIIQNSTPKAQALKTLEESAELLEAINSGDKEQIQLEAGDVLVTLIIVCALADVDLTESLAKAYRKIQPRKGYLDANGVFHKETS